MNTPLVTAFNTVKNSMILVDFSSYTGCTRKIHDQNEMTILALL